MGKLIINIKDDSKIESLLHYLKDLDFVEIVDEEKGVSLIKDETSFRKVFGIWKDRDITLNDIRDRAWTRKSK